MLDDFNDNVPVNAYAQLSRAHFKAGNFGAAETAASRLYLRAQGAHPYIFEQEAIGGDMIGRMRNRQNARMGNTISFRVGSM